MGSLYEYTHYYSLLLALMNKTFDKHAIIKFRELR